MPNENTAEQYLNKDELLEILNEIDTERQYEPVTPNGPSNEGDADLK